jgi:hypothetical protein
MVVCKVEYGLIGFCSILLPGQINFTSGRQKIEATASLILEAAAMPSFPVYGSTAFTLF